MDNAEKHTRAVANRVLKVSVQMGDNDVTVSVADNGQGILRHQRKAIFRPFDRPIEADRTPGLGLGLALARSLARAQNGDLEFDPSGTGATFVLTLPQAS